MKAMLLAIGVVVGVLAVGAVVVTALIRWAERQ